MNILITGGAGFIGSHLTDKLLEQGHAVVCVDNFELGTKTNLANALKNSRFVLIEGNAADVEFMANVMNKHQTQMVYHMAANSDIQKSSASPNIDFINTFSTTYGVLEAMRINEVKNLFFASTSAIYGEKKEVKLSENAGELAPISYYGGAKLASEAFISSYSYMNDFDVTIFRFPNVIGPRLTHGVIFDFIRKLQNNPSKLEILGDGTQEKPYIYVMDLVNAIIRVSQSDQQGVHIYNIGVESVTTVNEIADMVCQKMKLQNVIYEFTGGNRGWKGDVPKFQYDLTKIHQWGWYPSYTSNEAVQATLDHLL